MGFRPMLLASALSAGALVPVAALAQDTVAAAQEGESTQTPVAATDEPATAGEGDIVVTAQRRSESAQRVPISLTALPAETLVKTNVINVQDLGRVAPGFNAFRSAQAANTRLSIRGIGSPGNAAIEPSVGAFVDGIYIPRPGPLLAALNDVSSVEVLRGPQGTLFGRNASVGALSIHTAEPARDFGGSASIELGDFGRVRSKGIVNVPVADAVQTRFAVLHDRFEGYGYNLLDGEHFGRNDTLSFRGAVRAELAPSLIWLVRGDYQRQRGDGLSPVTVDASTITPAFATAFSNRLNGLTPRLDATYSYDVLQISDGRLRDEQGGISSDLSLELGGTTIKLISGWRDWHNRQSEVDIPYTRAFLFGRQAEYRSEMHSEELQIATPDDAPLSAVGGLYYFRERYQFDTIINFGRDYCNVFVRNTTPAGVAACLAAPQRGAGRQTFDQVTESYAAYGQATYKITPGWDATVGLRYSHDNKHGDLVSLAPNPLVTSLIVADSSDLRFDGGRLTYRLNTTVRPADDLLFYATLSTGYKSGGFDTGSGVALGNNRVFAPELVTNYELGAKTQFFGRRLTLNATLFRMDVDDFQLRSFNDTFYVVRNAGSIRQQGLEFDVAARPAPELTLSASGTLLDSKYTDFRNAPPLPGVAGTQDLTGRRVSLSPKWQGTAAADYQHRFDSGYAISANAHLGFTSDVDVGIAGDGNRQGIQPGYALLGTRIGLTLPDDRWEIAFSGENLTQKGYCVTKYGNGLGLNAAGTTVLRCVLGEPRTLRGSISLRF